MRRIWLWSVPIVIAGGAAFACLVVPPTHPLGRLAHVAGFAALALALELAWRGSSSRTPVYRRHLLLFGLLALLGGAAEIRRAGDLIGWLADLAGTVLGLALCSLPVVLMRMPSLGWQRGAARRGDPKAPLILVADPHWDGALTGLREARAAHPDADWLFLGDVFDVWVGVPGMDNPLEREFLDWVAAVRREGRWVGLWLGNREYFLDGLADRFDLMGEGSGGLANEGLAWEHGDLVNVADWRYRLWNLVSRSGLVWLFARMLPKATARALASRLQRALHTTNRAYKLAFPRAAFRAAAAEHPDETYITGHFHTHEVEANGIALPWAHEGRFALWRDGKLNITSVELSSDRPPAL
jgi:UDP-2,3-diacylglucosamine pyrophosphatase LpxH